MRKDVVRRPFLVRVESVEEANELMLDEGFARDYRLSEALSAVFKCVVFQRRIRKL